jgi:hypothetical protein
MRVSESMKTTTSWPSSTRRRARSITISEIWMWDWMDWSDEEAKTSPRTRLRRQWVTSSGRSSTRRTKIVVSG